jgi:hypothetical protein
MTAQPDTDRQTAVYVYGIIPSDVELDEGIQGIGDPPGDIRLIRHEELAALVSDVDVSRPLGRPDDLMGHEELLDSTSADVPVLPLRFGSVLADDEAVTSELLEAHHDEFKQALEELEGRAEYVVRGRYVEHAVLREVLTENDEAARLAEQTKDADENASRDVRMRLGEIISNAIASKRERDTATVVGALSEHAAGAVVREPTHELDAVYAAFLVATDEAPELEKALDQLRGDWDGRVEFRLLGPLAAYDFVGTAAPSREA